mgnify:CR=1 FL=1
MYFTLDFVILNSQWNIFIAKLFIKKEKHLNTLPLKLLLYNHFY